MAVPGKRSPESGKKDAEPSPEALLTIGQVVRELQTGFPDLSITKVRYLEDRGLLSPSRSKGRYRKYGKADVRRLRTILTLQRDEYLPLEVIRERVERAASSTLGRPLMSLAGAGGPSLVLSREQPLYTLKEVCEAAGVGEAFVRSLEEYHLIERAGLSGPAYTDTDLAAVRICHLLSRFQFEARNLRLLSSSAEREAALVEQVATTSLRSTHPDKKEYGVKMVQDLGSLFSQLNHLLLCRELRRLL
jgi:hypothetical protein